MKENSKVSEIINKFTMDNFKCTAKLDTDFMCDPEEEEIYYTFVVSERLDKMFMDALNTFKPEVEMDIFLWSILHEIGHIMTMDDLDELDYWFCQDVKNAISKGELEEEEYFILPDESLATEWAVNYANENKEKLELFWKELQPEILRFYADNGLMEVE